MSQHFITTHNASGQAIFSPQIPTEAHRIQLFPGASDTMQILYSNNTFKPNLSHEADIDAFATTRTNGLPPGKVAPENGVMVGIITFGANGESPTHRTLTLDTVLILEGVVELHLDSGDVRTLRAGDSVVQRATMHAWRNVTPDDGVVRMLGVSQSCEGAVEVGGKVLGEEWVY